jgi:hypothetical protein
MKTKAVSPPNLQIQSPNAAVDGQGACDDADSDAAGGRRSAEPERPRRRTVAAAGRMETMMKMKVTSPPKRQIQSLKRSCLWTGGLR